jgi:hypothetical protein
MRKSKWNTYKICCYTHQVGTNPMATGWVHVHSVRHTSAGWQTRISDSNGLWLSHGRVRSVSDADGEALYASVS